MRGRYGETTGITQAVRNYSASLGLAILGTVLLTKMRDHITQSVVSQGLPHARASAEATQGVLLGMAFAAVVTVFGLRRGLQVETGAIADGA